MNTTETCTEEQAIALAGVSARTLQRFCESGYLTQTTSAEGQALYIKRQLQDIFGALDSETETSEQDLPGDTDPAVASTGTVTAGLRDANNYATTELRTEPNPVKSPSSLDAAEEESTPSSTRSRISAKAEVEIERLKNLLAIQERMLDSKDDEIADLKNQRAWLRQRIEKLEEKHDRDQILLLSETQTIRSLIAYQESRKSGFRQLLEWIGIAPSSNYTALPQPHAQPATGAGATSGRTIEVRQAANHE
jgi:DNA-binding transcriptional MerR regulator